MYTEFYGLKEKPFNLTPSPRFVYMSEGHKEAMALLTYGVKERKGFILLTGEVGTGKTTMINNLIENLDSSVEYVYIVNPLLSPDEFIDYLAFSSFKKRVHFKSKADFLLEFEDYLKTCFQHQKIFILIIDEAHKLSFELMEEIRLLSNMEFAEEKLINIFLVGQPELNDNLNSPKGRATLQRIHIRHDIPPLSLKETGEYIETRLMVAGAENKNKIFKKGAIKAIQRFSQGYPRTINIIADNALLFGYSRGKKSIDAAMIEKAYNSMRLEGSFLKESEHKRQTGKRKSAQKASRLFKWIVAFFLILIIIALTVYMVRTSRISIPDLFEIMNSRKDHDTTVVSTPDQAGLQSDTEEDDLQDTEDAGSRLAYIEEKQASINYDATVDLKKEDPGFPGSKEENKSAIEGERQSTRLTNLHIFTFKRDTGFSKSVFAKEGDSLSRLAEKVYGAAGAEELALLKRYNPEISNLDNIEVGQRIFFPVYTILVKECESFEKADNLYQQLKKDGYDTNIIQPEADEKTAFFQVTVGAFKNRKEAEFFASNNLEGRSYNVPR